MQNSPIPITSRTTIRALAEHPYVDALPPLDLIVYLRLVVSADEHGISWATNGQLKPGRHGDPRPVVAALRRLEEICLVKIHYVGGMVSMGRSVSVLK